MTGSELETFATEVNGGDPIGSTLLFQLINLARALVEQRRPWVILRKTDTSKTVTQSSISAWQTAIDLSGITDLSRFYETEENAPIKLFDGNNRIEEYRQRPFEQRLFYKDVPNTFVYDEANKLLYLNGIVTLSGTLYIDYVRDPGDITDDDNSTWVFPSWSHSLLGFYAVAIHKGGIDFDSINQTMSPVNRAEATTILQALIAWDADKQLAAVRNSDYAHPPISHHRAGAINIDG